MKEIEKNYNPAEIEDRLYSKWQEKKYFHAEVDRSKKPFTIVMPPPNITGQLHMGHALIIQCRTFLHVLRECRVTKLYGFLELTMHQLLQKPRL